MHEIKNAPEEFFLIVILQLVSGWAAAEFYSRVSMIQVIGTILFEIILGTYFNHSIKFRFRYGQISQSNLLNHGLKPFLKLHLNLLCAKLRFHEIFPKLSIILNWIHFQHTF